MPQGKGSKTPIRAKGGTPPPITAIGLEFFVFWPIFNRIFNHGKGGYPPSPHHGKRPAKKLTEKITAKGGPPPHHGKKL